MKDILKPFRGNPDEWDVTPPMKCVFVLCMLLLLFLPTALYVMLLDISDQMFATFLYMIVADLVLLVLADVFIFLAWCPWCYPKRRSSPIRINTETFVELIPRLVDSREGGEEGAKDVKGSTPPVCVLDVHVVSSTIATNDPNPHVPEPELSEEQKLGFAQGKQRVSFNLERKTDSERFTTGAASNSNSNSQNQRERFQRHFSEPLPSRREFWYPKTHVSKTGSFRKSPVPESFHRYFHTTCGSIDAERGPNLVQRSFQGEIFVPLQKDQEPNELQQNLHLAEENGSAVNAGDVLQSSTPKSSDCNLNQNESFLDHGVSRPTQVVSKGWYDLNSSTQRNIMDSSEEKNTGTCNTSVDLSERTKVSQDQNGTTLGLFSLQHESRHGRHRKRFWTNPQCSTRISTNRDEANQSSESLNEIVNALDDELARSFQVKPRVKGFTKLKKRHSNCPDYMASFRRRRTTRSSISSSNIDDELGLLPISYDESKLSSTAAWVSDDKNALPSNSSSDEPSSLRRSRSAPSKQRQISTSERTSDRQPIPAYADDNRPRVLHRLLATILTTGDDVVAPYPELNEEEDAPKIEVEAMPSGDYVMYMSLRLSSNELENFRSRRATNVKKSEFKKYLDSLC